MLYELFYTLELDARKILKILIKSDRENSIVYEAAKRSIPKRVLEEIMDLKMFYRIQQKQYKAGNLSHSEYAAVIRLVDRRVEDLLSHVNQDELVNALMDEIL